MTATPAAGRQYTDGEYLKHNPTWHVEDSPWKAAHVLEMLKRHNLSPRTVCEVGAGAGEILRQLHDRMGPEVRFAGYEVSPQAYDLARTRETERLRFHLRDAFEEAAGEGYERYDLALAMDVIEHVEDYFSFLRKLRGLAEYKVLHIPLDIYALSAVTGTLIRGRTAMGHIHYFTRATALAALGETGYRVIDHFYTPGFTAPGPPVQRWQAKALNRARRLLWYVNRELSVRVLGGSSILVLAQ